MRLSKLIEKLVTVKQANGSFDLEVRIVSEELDHGVMDIGCLDSFVLIQTEPEEFVPCQNCGEGSDRLCGCDK